MYLRVMTSFCSYALTINFVNTVCLRACISLGEFKVACWRDHVLSCPCRVWAWSWTRDGGSGASNAKKGLQLARLYKEDS